MTVGELKRRLDELKLDDNDIVVVTQGNSYPSFKITGVEDSTCAGVWEIRFTDFETNNFWEE